jgi:hypothetical protein
LLRRFPGLPLLAVPAEPDGTLPTAFTGVPATQVPLDESTTLYLFSGISDEQAATGYYFVLREPMTGTRFGFDLAGTNAGNPMTTWAQLEWDQVNLDGGRFIEVSAPPKTQPPSGGDLAVWGNGSADMARIAFQQPFQLAIHASKWLRP